MFPTESEAPPIITRRPSLAATSGARSNASATLVSGPSVTSVSSPGSERTAAMRTWTTSGEIEPDVSHAVLAVHELRGAKLADSWAVAACVNRRGPVYEVTCVESILDRLFQRNVPGDYCDRDDGGRFVAERHQQRDS